MNIAQIKRLLLEPNLCVTNQKLISKRKDKNIYSHMLFVTACFIEFFCSDFIFLLFTLALAHY